MSRAFKYSAPLLVFAMISFAFAGSSTLSRTEPKKQDSINVRDLKPISRDELVYMVDSILDLDTVPAVAIEMLNHYSAELEKMKTVKLNALPASDIYDSFDEENLFTLATDECLPDLKNIVVQNDSLGNYTPPICGIVTSNYGWRD